MPEAASTRRRRTLRRRQGVPWSGRVREVAMRVVAIGFLYLMGPVDVRPRGSPMWMVWWHWSEGLAGSEFVGGAVGSGDVDFAGGVVEADLPASFVGQDMMVTTER